MASVHANNSLRSSQSLVRPVVIHRVKAKFCMRSPHQHSPAHLRMFAPYFVTFTQREWRVFFDRTCHKATEWKWVTATPNRRDFSGAGGRIIIAAQTPKTILQLVHIRGMNAAGMSKDFRQRFGTWCRTVRSIVTAQSKACCRQQHAPDAPPAPISKIRNSR